ncbi:hypothetical protein [Paenarthrobacter nitroguajacolicus]|uniref:hypothetical protein n=1 Tax=Paenarthrobacter nitroguajacolicus TaxID=211146 RepID=UPI00248AD1B3|nr:hypothetical protein [Paenarthrobacter nitroguajacolicus]MDI2037133.1 hypothetical protein [Paenarthrobacter nitroguajacolicus]
MDHRVTFPDFSAFQIDLPYGPWPHDASWSGDRHSDPDLYSAFWPEFGARPETSEAAAPPGGE